MSSLQRWLAEQVRGMVEEGRKAQGERPSRDELSRRLAEAVGQAEADRQRALYGRGAPVPRPETDIAEGGETS